MTKEELVAEFNNNFNYVSINARRHTCEVWNGLGDDFFGKAALSEKGRSELVSFILKAFEAGERADREHIVLALKDGFSKVFCTRLECINPIEIIDDIVSHVTKDV